MAISPYLMVEKSGALLGGHYCKDHQGNTSHYDKKNCLVCNLEAKVKNLEGNITSTDGEMVTIEKKKIENVLEYVRILNEENAHLKGLLSERIFDDIRRDINKS